MASSNYSVYSIPVFFVMNMLPRWYSAIIISDGSLKNWNNANPRSADWHAAFRKRASADQYLRWEQARAAHNNGLEFLPLLVAAVVLGNMAKLDSEELNRACGSLLLVRAAYILTYIGISNLFWSYSRTFLWMYSIWQCPLVEAFEFSSLVLSFQLRKFVTWHILCCLKAWCLYAISLSFELGLKKKLVQSSVFHQSLQSSFSRFHKIEYDDVTPAPTSSPNGQHHFQHLPSTATFLTWA